MRRNKFFRTFVLENLSYKMVALLIALILWITILGRRDFVMTKNVEVDLLTGPGFSVVSQTSDAVKVKVNGPRTALKKFIDSASSHSIALDISGRGVGFVDVSIPQQKIEVPFGVKIIGIRPNVIRAEVIQVKPAVQPLEAVPEQEK
jgi:YbbR domain-containing protein